MLALSPNRRCKNDAAPDNLHSNVSLTEDVAAMPGQRSEAVLLDQWWAGPRIRSGRAQWGPIAPLPVPVPALPLSPGSRTAQKPFPEAVYEEIGYSPVWEKQTRFDRSGECGSSLEAHLQDSFPWPQPSANALKPSSLWSLLYWGSVVCGESIRVLDLGQKLSPNQLSSSQLNSPSLPAHAPHVKPEE